MHDGAHDQALFTGIEGAHAVGKSFGEHGYGTVDEIDGIAAEPRFTIERRFGMNVMGDVGDMHLQEPAAIFAALNVDGIVEIARGFPVNGDNGKLAEILTASTIGFRNGQGEACCVLQKLLR